MPFLDDEISAWLTLKRKNEKNGASKHHSATPANTHLSQSCGASNAYTENGLPRLGWSNGR